MGNLAKKHRVPLHYWDTCNFLTILKRDEVHLDGCVEVLKAAEDGKLKIVTSSITLAAIIKIGHSKEPALPESDESRIIETFFLHEYLILRDFDRKTAEMARSLAWRFQIKAFDAMHVATAIRSKVDVFETTDASLIKKIAGKVGEPIIDVRPPYLPVKQLEVGL
jgi:predicted nucleic acid-binding protein